jgi:SAM-dependent methyltransferase
MATAPDRHQIEKLNSLWAIIDAPVESGSARARLAGIVRRLIGRVLARQQEFNATIVDHINRNMSVMEDLSRTQERMDDLVDEMRRHREALLARERRSEATVAALAATQQELRATVSVLQQATLNLKREIQSGANRDATGMHPERVPNATGMQSGRIPNEPATTEATHAPSSQMTDLDSHKYVGFEDQFRGSTEDIRHRIEEYLPVFQGASDVLDIGCGRGEFLALLREHGVSARGIDLNPTMVEVCRSQGLAAEAIDGLAYLRAQPDGSLGGLFAAQVVEHLEPRYLTQLLDLAFDKLRPGSPIVLETINPACWFAFFESYIRDITHVRPLHPDTLKYLLIASGFQQVEIRYRAPYPDSDKLQPIPTAAADRTVADWAETLNSNAEKLNRLLFTYLDYAAIGRRA